MTMSARKYRIALDVSTVVVAGAIVGNLLFAAAACTREQQRDARAAADVAFKGADLACIFGEGADIIDADALASFCRIEKGAEKMLPLLRELIGVREGAKRAGVAWPRSDGGAARDGGTR